MDRNEIKEMLREVLGPNAELIDHPEFVGMHCPMAKYTHEKGIDSTPSAGISVKEDGGTSIYNCLAGSTKVVTREGVRPIAVLAGTTPELLMPDGTWLSAPVEAFGLQKLMEITLSRNGRKKIVYATAGHRWFAKSGSKSAYLERRTYQLMPGYRMQAAFPTRRTDWSRDYTGVLHGLFFGDGTVHPTRTSHGRLSLFGACMPLALSFMGRGLSITLSNETARGTPYNDVTGQLGYMKSLPLHDSTDSYLLGFLSGLIAADGHVDRKGNVSIASARLSQLEKVQDICTVLGISCFGISRQWRIGIDGVMSSMYTLRLVPSTIDPVLLILPDQSQRLADRDAAYERLHWVVVSVKETQREEEVFCAEVPGYHAFTLEGNLLTGNCFVCGKGTVPWFLRQMEKYTGESYTPIIRNIETGEFLGGSLPNWGSKKVATRVEKLLDKDVYLDLYDSAEGHPYFSARAAKHREVVITDDTVRTLGLLVDPGDRAGDERILFPVFSAAGDLYGFTGRATDDSAELRIRDYHGLPKARVLLGIHLVRAEDAFVVVVEGLFDYAVSVQYDYPAVATLHAGLTSEQARLLVDLGKPVVLMYDNDQAGKDATEKAIKALKKHLPLSVVTYPKPPLNPRGRKIKWLKDPAGCTKEQMDQMIAKATVV